MAAKMVPALRSLAVVELLLATLAPGSCASRDHGEYANSTRLSYAIRVDLILRSVNKQHMFMELMHFVGYLWAI